MFRLYFTKVKMGSPPREFNVQIDTGSDILWVNCNTCSNCPQSSELGVSEIFQFFIIILTCQLRFWWFGAYTPDVLFFLFACVVHLYIQIQLNFFDTLGSSTAVLVPCSDPICTSGVQGAAAQCYPQVNQCSYTFQYGDDSGTSGYYVSDALYFDMIREQSLPANSSATIVFGWALLYAYLL